MDFAQLSHVPELRESKQSCLPIQDGFVRAFQFACENVAIQPSPTFLRLACFFSSHRIAKAGCPPQFILKMFLKWLAAAPPDNRKIAVAPGKTLFLCLSISFVAASILNIEIALRLPDQNVWGLRLVDV